ncbi:thioredoxin [Haliovirga abyssi]|uniref:Thioredoxin n=1 Tax=Haliovirga abyssi TaxID=2996794 RepID=A0AAU9DTL7_9FUSO|nr:thioredoxin [Haliovirga abyssi]BDU50529.1 thioredoxin [Haliovirga abyssi]
MNKIVYLNNSNFKSEVLDSEKLVIVDFWAEWCMPCRMVAPILEELSEELENVKISKLNVDEVGEIAAEFGIRSIPTLLFFKGGKIIDKSVGAMPKETLKIKIESHL